MRSNYMLKLKCFIIGMTLPLPLPANRIVYCPPPPPPFWVFQERREREQRELNEQMKQGNNENQEMTLPETVFVLMSFAALSTLLFVCFWGLSSIFLSDKEKHFKEDREK